MTTVTIDDKYAAALSPLGRLEDVTHVALRRYAVSEIAENIAELQSKRNTTRRNMALALRNLPVLQRRTNNLFRVWKRLKRCGRQI